MQWRETAIRQKQTAERAKNAADSQLDELNSQRADDPDGANAALRDTMNDIADKDLQIRDLHRQVNASDEANASQVANTTLRLADADANAYSDVTHLLTSGQVMKVLAKTHPASAAKLQSDLSLQQLRCSHMLRTDVLVMIVEVQVGYTRCI